jgi:hypothetical protein
VGVGVVVTGLVLAQTARRAAVPGSGQTDPAGRSVEMSRRDPG